MTKASKYDRLGVYLETQSRTFIPMTFGDIERLLDTELPPSKSLRAWWSNNPNNNVMTRQWLRAGYKTESVDIAGEKLVFRRVRPRAAQGASVDGDDGSGSGGGSAPSRRDPVFGCMKGTLALDADVDLTEPANPAWGKVYEDG